MTCGAHEKRTHSPAKKESALKSWTDSVQYIGLFVQAYIHSGARPCSTYREIGGRKHKCGIVKILYSLVKLIADTHDVQ